VFERWRGDCRTRPSVLGGDRLGRGGLRAWGSRRGGSRLGMLGTVRLDLVAEGVMRTLTLPTGLVDGVLGLVFLHGVADDG